MCIMCSYHAAHFANRARPHLPEAVIDLIAGAMGEAVQMLILYPLDTIKARLGKLQLHASNVFSEAVCGWYFLMIS